MHEPARDRVLIEGSLGEAPDIQRYHPFAMRLCWDPVMQALLPDRLIARDLVGMTGLVSLGSVRDPAEAMRIAAAARGFGMRPVLSVPPGWQADRADLHCFTAFDQVIFATPQERDMAWDGAADVLPRLVTLPERWTVAGAAIAAGASATAPGPEPARIYFWVGLTVTQEFNTGIQRVARALGSALARRGIELILVKCDEVNARLLPVLPKEAARFARWNGPETKPDGLELKPIEPGSWLILPEINTAMLGRGSNVARIAHSHGLRVAGIFHDLIALKLPHFFPRNHAEIWAGFWDSYSEMDVVLPNSWSTANDLITYWRDRGLPPAPLVAAPLAAGFDATPRRQHEVAPPAAAAPLRLLAVGTWEQRKNYPLLLRALARARRRARRPVTLTIVGRNGLDAELDHEIRLLAESCGDVTLAEHLSDPDLAALFAASHATILASFEEGFGLPVLESFWHALPCICHRGSAMREVAAEGGALLADMADEHSIAAAIAELADTPGLLTRLSREAITRPIRSWDDYARDVCAAIAGRTPPVPPPPPLPAPALSCIIAGEGAIALPPAVAAECEVLPCAPADLAATVAASRGAFIWVVEAADVLAPTAIQHLLAVLRTAPAAEVLLCNAERQTAEGEAMPVGWGGRTGAFGALRAVIGRNETLLLRRQCCVLRRDHALRVDFAAPFGWTGYAILHLLDRPCFWTGEPMITLAEVVPEPVAILRDIPALLDLAELKGLDRTRLDLFRERLVPLLAAAIAAGPALEASMLERIMVRFRHLPGFARMILSQLPDQDAAAQALIRRYRIRPAGLPPVRPQRINPAALPYAPDCSDLVAAP